MQTPLRRGIMGSALITAATVLLSAIGALGFERYYADPIAGTGNCSTCHGAFTDSTSPKQTMFPSSSKHEMHRASGNMATACNLCHTSGDNHNPWIGSSTGTANNQGLGCSGCHVGAGLRAHHATNGETVCYNAGCHTPQVSAPETVDPPYYGTIDTKARNAGNPVKASNTNENWSVGDYLGLDNDGNNLYDVADPAVNPYRILSAVREGNNDRVTWRTAGGRKDVLQGAVSVTGPYSNIVTITTTTNVGIVNTNFVEIGGATNGSRFYRVKLGS